MKFVCVCVCSSRETTKNPDDDVDGADEDSVENLLKLMQLFATLLMTLSASSHSDGSILLLFLHFLAENKSCKKNYAWKLFGKIFLINLINAKK